MGMEGFRFYAKGEPGPAKDRSPLTWNEARTHVQTRHLGHPAKEDHNPQGDALGYWHGLPAAAHCGVGNPENLAMKAFDTPKVAFWTVWNAPGVVGKLIE